jgi:heme exporter protein C
MAINLKERKAKLSSVFGIISFITVPLSYVSVELITLHPGGGAPLSKLSLTSPMILTLLVALASITSIYFLLLSQTIELSRIEERVNAIRYGGASS